MKGEYLFISTTILYRKLTVYSTIIIKNNY